MLGDKKSPPYAAQVVTLRNDLEEGIISTVCSEGGDRSPLGDVVALSVTKVALLRFSASAKRNFSEICDSV